MAKNRTHFVISVVILCNLALAVLKFYIGTASAALCIYTDAINNLLDTFSGLLALFALLLAKSYIPTENYPRGLSRLENLTGFTLSAVIFVSGLYFAYTAVERFFYPRPVSFMLKYALLLSLGVILKLILGIFCRFYDKKHPSVILKTIYTDSFSDCAVALMTIISFVLGEYSGLRLDSICGFAISIIIIINAIRLIRATGGEILGRQNPAENEKIKAFLESNGCTVKSIHTEKYGEKTIVLIKGSGQIAQNYTDKNTEFYFSTED